MMSPTSWENFSVPADLQSIEPTPAAPVIHSPREIGKNGISSGRRARMSPDQIISPISNKNLEGRLGHPR